MAEKYPVKPVMDNPHPGFELRDTNLRAVLWFGVAMVVALVLIFVLVWLLFGFFYNLDLRESPPPPPLLKEAQALPPVPRLQRLPGVDLAEMRAEEDAQLNNYGWVDKEAGVVRLPIERAIELTLERGLPTRTQSQEEGQ